MKIGIMTFWYSENNYGQILQCYALQKYLRDAGHDVYLIRYDPKNDYIQTPLWLKILKTFNPFLLFNYLFSKYRTQWERVMHPRYFSDFRNKYITQSKEIYLSYDELAANPPKADIYVTGSDQVWNTFGVSAIRVNNRLNAYFLNFGKPEIPRVAYAASIGTDYPSADLISVYSNLLKKFSYVSVREQSGVDICNECGFYGAERVPDPTMLLTPEHYRLLYKDRNSEKPFPKAYCFIYLIDGSRVSLGKIIRWVKRNNLDYIYVSGNFKYDTYKKYYATIPDWLYLLDNSEYVITNSYHGSVFSLIFKKKFGIIPLSGKLAGANNRFISLFKQFDINPRFLSRDINKIKLPINWETVEAKFIQFRSETIQKLDTVFLEFNRKSV
jgi:hypothetical protein